MSNLVDQEEALGCIPRVQQLLERCLQQAGWCQAVANARSSPGARGKGSSAGSLKRDFGAYRKCSLLFSE